jgi:hypothetical protein
MDSVTMSCLRQLDVYGVTSVTEHKATLVPERLAL